MSTIESPAQVARYIDHTLLRPEVDRDDVMKAVHEASELSTYSVCVSPSMLPIRDVPAGLKVAAVCGFPSGQHLAAIKADEAKAAVEGGADEIDMVLNLGALIGGDKRGVEKDIRRVREAVPHVVLKVIIESAALTGAQIVLACRAAEDLGADFVKTSTGFHPAGGATVQAVRLMRETVSDQIGVKASGGIRTLSSAREFIAAGATRLGVSASRLLLEGVGGVADTADEGAY
ncbi:deoxyribose-phosphate aldolase [Brevibacterium linens]|uniref:deoxyribose-phosphate aldolase n=1 Tax=Brevibacterium linens TaxID=1703 RepID=UPI003BF58F98